MPLVHPPGYAPVVIFALDGAGETHLANHIRSYGEPVQGECVCVYHIYLNRSHTLNSTSNCP